MTTLLIVDDSAQSIFLLENQLKSKGYEVFTARNGKQALEIAHQTDLDLVISDILMPEMDGFSLCREWMKNSKLRKVPFVFFTATYTDKKDESLGLGLGAARYIPKPIDLNSFMQIVEEVLQKPGLTSPINDFAEKPEEEFLCEYNQALVRKLENKMLELEVKNQQLLNTQNELKKYSGQLEQMVDARTKELQSANAELKEAKEAAEFAAKAKSEFLANMSHEIRTPMNGVIAAADLALGEELSSKVKRYLKIIHSSGISLLGIINDILDFSKINAGKLEIEATEFHLNNVLTKVTQLFVNSAMKKGIELIIDMDPDLPVALVGDALRLQQILTNLIGNAVKFTPREGVIAISVKEQETSGEEIVLDFAVRDTGIGMTDEQTEKLFAPFTQADASTTRKYGGTGLGLTISKSLVEMMRGKIWVDSQFEQGTTFHFTIPFTRQPEDKKVTITIPQEIEGLNILVVDDCKDSQAVYEKLLKAFKFKVVSVSLGNDALDLLKQRQHTEEAFDLVLMDWMMPELDGIETSKIIRTDMHLDIPIIMLTAFGQEAEKDEANRIGINKYLIKPVEPSKLFNTILEVFGKEAYKIGRFDKDKPKSSKYSSCLAGFQVLVAEDNPTNQEIAQAVLESVGIVPFIADNGQKAIESLYSHCFDAVLMDVQMPVMDGFDATRSIRRDPNFASLPIIAMTAYAMKGDAEKCIQAGMNDYIAKPINQEKLFKILWEYLEGRKPCIPKQPPDVHIAARPKENDDARLPILPGVDIQTTLDALNIDWHTFKCILLGFFKANKKTVSLLWDAFSEKDWDFIHKSAHNVKGSAGNIGANALQEIAKKLEAECRQEKQETVIKALLLDFESALNQVMSAFETLLTPLEIDLPKAQVTGIDSQKIIPFLYKIYEAIRSSNPAEIKKGLQDMRPYVPHPLLRELEEKLSQYEFDDALASLEEIGRNYGVEF